MTTTQGIDFKTLTLMDALDLAVLTEEEARDRYGELADQLEIHHTPEAAAFFRTMSKIEERHRAVLADRRAKAFGDKPRAVRREMLFEVEAPEYDQARAFMTVREALETALESEIKAYEFFAAAVPNIEDPKTRALMAELRDEETVHQELVKKEMAKLVDDRGSGRVEDYEDPPTSQ
jgi:rubrerythrin